MPHETFDRLPQQKKDAILAGGIAEFSRKSYADASTDAITRGCGISKGLLFHYFGNKKAFYLYCVECALEKLTEPPKERGEDFYGIIFASMDGKMRLCARYPDETRLVNMAAKEMSAEVFIEKSAIIARYALRMRAASEAVIARAVAALPRKSADADKTSAALSLYANALVTKTLEEYRDRLDAFMADAEKIQADMKQMLDLLLYGIARQDEKEDRHEKA